MEEKKMKTYEDVKKELHFNAELTVEQENAVIEQARKELESEKVR